MIANMVESARRAKAPVVGIPIPGENAFCVRRDLLVGSLKGLMIIDAGIQLPLDGNERGRRLVVYAAGDRVKAVRQFAPIERNAVLPKQWQWAERERERRKQPKRKMTAREREIEKLEKRLAKMGKPEPPKHPLLAKPRNADRVREQDAHRLREWEEWEAEGHAHTERPLTVGQTWARWKRQANVRRWIQQQARQAKAGKVTTTQLYRTLAERGVPAQRWSDLRKHDRDRCRDLFGYLDKLWEFCGVALRPTWYFEPEPEPTCGAEHYAGWIAELRQYKELEALIAGVKAL